MCSAMCTMQAAHRCTQCKSKTRHAMKKNALICSGMHTMQAAYHPHHTLTYTMQIACNAAQRTVFMCSAMYTMQPARTHSMQIQNKQRRAKNMLLCSAMHTMQAVHYPDILHRIMQTAFDSAPKMCSVLRHVHNANCTPQADTQHKHEYVFGLGKCTVLCHVSESSD